MAIEIPEKMLAAQVVEVSFWVSQVCIGAYSKVFDIL
jgi:hypothetical protein